MDLTVGTIRSPSYKFFHYGPEEHRPNPSPSHLALRPNMTDAECALPPVGITVRANNKNVVVKHSEWEVACRQVSEGIHSMVGSIEVRPHPVFEGHVRLSTTVGAISVEEANTVDPAGEGRHRVVDMVKTMHNGAKSYNGFVRWSASEEAKETEKTEGTEETEEAEEMPAEEEAPALARRSLFDFDLDERDEIPDPRPPGPHGHGHGPKHGHGHGHGHHDGPPPPWAPREPGLTVETSVGSVTVVF